MTDLEEFEEINSDPRGQRARELLSLRYIGKCDCAASTNGLCVLNSGLLCRGGYWESGTE
jgi:hypothetical protein